MMQPILVNNAKNRERDPFSFANINLLGRCNVDCFFCLGKDIADVLAPHNQTRTPFEAWKNFELFLNMCQAKGVRKLYITGQNTDSLLYAYLKELIDFLHKRGFLVGLRTNGYQIQVEPSLLDVINTCDLSVGYSIHSLDPLTNRMIMRRDDIPNWKKIISETRNPRLSIVLNRCNEDEFYSLLRFGSSFPNVRYIQVRRVSTDTRFESLAPDMVAYERVYTTVRRVFPLKAKVFGDAEVYDVYGKDVVFWRTIKTTVNSMNYFTDGTVSDEYFVVEGYLKHRGL